MSRFDVLPYIMIALWSMPFVVAVVTLAVCAFKARAKRRAARGLFGLDGPAYRALLSLMREEGPR